MNVGAVSYVTSGQRGHPLLLDTGGPTRRADTDERQSKQNSAEERRIWEAFVQQRDKPRLAHISPYF